MDLKETAITFRINIGVTRSGETFIDADTIENVLGDVPHKRCLNAIAAILVAAAESCLQAHAGSEPVVETLEEDELISFFDKAQTIDE